MKYCYSIHDLLNISVKGTRFTTPINNIDIEFAQFRTQSLTDMDIVIKLGPFDPELEDTVILDNSYYVGDDYLYGEDSYEYASWKFQIQGFESEPLVVHIDTNFFGKFLISGILIEPLIYYALNKKGYPVVHASGISDGENGYLFAGPSGGGKTTHALEFTKHGFKILSDDSMIFLDEQIAGFPHPINVFSYNLTDQIQTAMRWSDTVKYVSNKILKKTTGYSLATKLPLSELSCFSRNGQHLTGIFLLLRSDQYSIEEISKEQLINRLVQIQKLDNMYFTKYLREYSFEFPDHSPADHWETYTQNLRDKIHADTDLFVVEVPDTDEKRFDKIWEKIESA